MQSDGPENFIDRASREEVSAGSTEEPSRTSPSGPLHELRQLDLRDEEKVRLAKEQSKFFAYEDECRAKRRKQDAEAEKARHEATKARHEAAMAGHEATKARHEANAREWTARHARKRSLTVLWRDWIFLGILVIATFTGIGAIVYGITTEATRATVTGVAILSGPSGTAILGLTRNRSGDDENQGARS